MESDKPTVVITGISGFLGSRVAEVFLKSGQFRVKGTVRSATNEKKIAPIREGLGDLFRQLELVEADLLNAESLMKAIEGATYVVHTASPIPTEIPKNEDLLIKPAVEGTLAVLRACDQHQVKRCVLTSSVAAIMWGKFKTGYQFTDQDWNDPGNTAPYEKSKTLAEEAAWSFLKNTATHKFELVTINPGIILGKPIIPGEFASSKIVIDMMTGKMPAVPKCQFGFVDVEDVAKAHLQAVLVPEAAGRRFILSAETLWFLAILQGLKNEFKKYGYKICVHEVNKLIKFMSCFDKRMESIVQLLGKEFTFDNSPAK